MFKFRPLYRRALLESRKEGRITQQQFDILWDAYVRPNRANAKGEKVNLISEAEKCAKKHTKGINWPAIFQWLKENWVTIIKLLLSLIPLFLQVSPDQPAD